MTCRRLNALKKWSLAVGMGTALTFSMGGCNLSQITTTTTTTLDARDVVTQMIQSVLITPLQSWITDRVDAFFDQFDD